MSTTATESNKTESIFEEHRHRLIFFFFFASLQIFRYDVRPFVLPTMPDISYKKAVCDTKKGSTPFLYESARAEIQLGVTGNMLSTTLTK